ncbi:fumarylacetoacetate hydrolase family protein [Fodinibius halophilus]|uniref:Fumarylacetoacetate hydrolase family protein n=1 Tax=Fodinibius halophilus TaxID=1736908 RepID=A0A6M1T976_9BACT|nr:fumarylacetoacetate hydrolase family protein [Fodinibius halophilus]NGP88551.1 fumarylacetoacetate hydrolase family protein [Fodinibius halophilus]
MSQKNLSGLPELHIGNIYCIGRNYVEHAHELENEVPDQPLVFLKPSNSIIEDGETIKLPPQSDNVHHEVEMVAAIGKEGKNIPEKEALSYVAGYAVGIDVTARDIQQRAKDNAHPWAVAKGFDTFAPLGPFVPANTIEDPQNVELQIDVNGECRQSDNTKLMIFPVAKLVHYLSTIFTLQPGDLIFTGTPKGVSPLKAGDTIKAVLGDDLSKLTIAVQ